MVLEAIRIAVLLGENVSTHTEVAENAEGAATRALSTMSALLVVTARHPRSP